MFQAQHMYLKSPHLETGKPQIMLDSTHWGKTGTQFTTNMVNLNFQRLYGWHIQNVSQVPHTVVHHRKTLAHLF